MSGKTAVAIVPLVNTETTGGVLDVVRYLYEVLHTFEVPLSSNFRSDAQKTGL